MPIADAAPKHRSAIGASDGADRRGAASPGVPRRDRLAGEEQGLEVDVDDGGSTLADDAADLDGEEASGPPAAEEDADLSDLDHGEGHDDDRVGAERTEDVEGDFAEDDARDDDDARGPEDDDARALDDLEGEGDEGDDAEAGGDDDDDLEGPGDQPDEDDGGAEGIRDEDPSDAIDEPPALDGADGEGEGLDEPLPELEEPS